VDELTSLRTDHGVLFLLRQLPVRRAYVRQRRLGGPGVPQVHAALRSPRHLSLAVTREIVALAAKQSVV